MKCYSHTNVVDACSDSRQTWSTGPAEFGNSDKIYSLDLTRVADQAITLTRFSERGRG